MSLRACIPDLVAKGEITPERAAEMSAIYDELETHYRKSMGEPAAAALASTETIERLSAEAFHRKRQGVLQIAAQSAAKKNLAAYPGSIGKAAMALFDHDDRAPYSNVESRRKAILGRSHAMMEGVLSRHRRRVTGVVRDRAGLKDLVREAFGESTGNVSAHELADAWTRTAEMLRQRFNAAGGAIGKLERWGLPQMHDSVKVRRADFREWRDFIAPRLDASKMLDETGQPMTAQGVEASLQHVYQSIRTEGWNERQPGSIGGKKLANRRADSRFLVFRDADAWLEYQERFGAATPFDSMMGHLSGMSRDIALMEVLGPNPTATVRWVKDVVGRDAAMGDGNSLDAAKGASKRVQEMFDTITGTASTPISTNLARYGMGTRALLTSAMLGKAALSAFTDTAFQAVTRRFNGLPVTGALTGYVKLFRPYMSKDQKLAIRLGLIAEEASAMASAQNRYIGEAVGPELASRIADGVLRVSGLSPWTQAGRWAFGMEFLGHLADNSDRAFSKLHPRFRGVLERYGIGSAEWQTIRATPLYEERGASFLRPADVKDHRLGDKLLEMIATETDYAVPSATVAARSFLNVGQPGTIMGEAAKSALLFKSFGVSMLLTHGRRMAQQQGFSRVRYAAALAITTTLAAAVTIQMKEIMLGKDPRPMTDEKFWGAAMLQGGGFGIFGDFIASTENRYGGGLAETLAGPVVSAGTDLGDLTLGNAFKAVAGKETDVGHDVSRMSRRYLPGGSIWYSRLAFERLMLDDLSRWLDPDADEMFDRMESYAEKHGTEYYWEPGEKHADRGANWANALEDAD